MPAHVFNLGAWEPDKAAIEIDGVVDALNCVPGASGYAPFGALVTVTDALDAYPRGAVQLRDDSNAVFQYCGDAAKLYRNVSDAWTDASVSGGYSTAAGDAWEFAKWRNTIIATNYTDNPQTLTLGGTTFADLTSALTFKHVAVIRDFVVAGYTDDNTDGEVPWRVRWCAFQDPTDWTVDPSTLADFEDLPQRKIQRIFGGEYGIIFQDESITRMTFVGAPLVFQFDEIVPGLGLLAPGAAVRANDIIFFLSPRGFYALANGSQVQPIGLDKVDDFVLQDLDRSNLHRISAAADPENQRVFFCYPGTGSVDGVPNKIVCFDYGRGRWSHIDQVCELLWEASGAAVTLEGLDSIYPDIDAMPISMDSPTLIGGQRTLAGFFSDYKSGFFNGAARTATIVTREYMFDGDRRTRVGGFRPMVEGDAVSLTARIGTRSDIAQPVVWSELKTPRTGGRVVCRTNGRYHRIELNVSGDWSKAFGILVDKRDVGSGGRRG